MRSGVVACFWIGLRIFVGRILAVVLFQALFLVRFVLPRCAVGLGTLVIGKSLCQAWLSGNTVAVHCAITMEFCGRSAPSVIVSAIDCTVYPTIFWYGSSWSLSVSAMHQKLAQSGLSSPFSIYDWKAYARNRKVLTWLSSQQFCEPQIDLKTSFYTTVYIITSSAWVHHLLCFFVMCHHALLDFHCKFWFLALEKQHAYWYRMHTLCRAGWWYLLMYS